ncbi:MAG: arylesterase [Piscirickettsiaceae bacterium]|nr:arylesterase [Piscirickettsiaceae bacterium]
MSTLSKQAILLLFILFAVGCSDNQTALTPLKQDAVILAFGDSLTFGTGANSETESYPAVLQQLTGRTVINAGIPGEVSQFGLERLSTVLNEVKPDLVSLCHGGNDLIHRLDQQQLKSNLEQMIVMIQQSGSQVILIGVPNFNLMLTVPDLYLELAEIYDIPVQTEIISKLQRSPTLKSDNIHPNAAGYYLFAEHIETLLIESGAL